uniref:Uncharacterized protein n=1 Tax=Knufia peltigerae TaxID=1002370 RepID=A0AA38XUG0_9EURO|nr:hypothetical protein H2204_011415 [Knufia peltigerae]
MQQALAAIDTHAQRAIVSQAERGTVLPIAIQLHAHFAPGQHVERCVTRQERRQPFAVEFLQRRQQACQHRGHHRVAIHRCAGQCVQVHPRLGDLFGEGRRHVHVDADADHCTRRAGVFATTLGQQAHQLAAINQHIVRPLQLRLRIAQVVQGFGDGDAGDQAQPGQAAEATLEQAQYRQIHMRGQRRGPGAPATATAAGLALGQHDADTALGRAAAQQFGVGGVHRPGHLQVVQQCCGLLGQAGADGLGLQQVDRPGQPVALASTPFNLDTGGPKPLNTLPNGGPGLAQLTGQGVAGQATGSEFGQQLAIVHGSFHKVRTELCGKAASDARWAWFRRASNLAPGSG